MTPSIVHIRADNPGWFTLTGTNSYVLDGAWVIDPGPDLPAHLDALAAAAPDLQGIAVTHHHADHTAGVAGLHERFGAAVPVAAWQWEGATVRLGDGDTFGPLTALPTPGHSPDHLAFVAGDAGFTGDAVLGEGSVFVAPGPGSLTGYLAALARLRELGLRVLHPGHGPLIADPAAKLDEYIAHRLDRERLLLAALDSGLRSEDELIDSAWSDAPPQLRIGAALALRAHLGKLSEEGRLPAGVAVSDWPDGVPRLEP